MMYFIYNGIDSREVGLKIKDLPFDIMPQKRYQELVLDRFDGTIYTEEDTFESFPLSIECIMIDNFTTDDIRGVKNLFKSGSGEIIFSHKPNHVYSVRITSVINFVEMLEYTGSCTISLKVEPFAKLKSGETYTKISSGSILNNLGNYFSRPIYKITGSGDFSISINDKTMKFINVTSKTLLVDVELEDVYSEDGENYNNYLAIESDFIPLEEGENKIEYSSGISSLEIMPRWREL